MKCIAIVGPYPPPYGGWAHVVVSVSRSPFSDAFEMLSFNTGFGTGSTQLVDRSSKALQALRHIFEFQSFLRNNRPDLVLIFTGPGYSFWRDIVLMRLCIRHSQPFMVRFFGGVLVQRIAGWSGPLRHLTLATLSCTQALLVETNEMSRVAQAILPSLPSYRIVNCVHITDFPVKAQQPFEPRSLNVLFVGNMTPTKGVEVILQAVDRVCDKINARFHFVGGEITAGYLERFRARASQCRHSDSIVIYGAVDHSQVLEIATDAHIFAFPTAWPGEGQPATLLEAMAVGLVPIVTPWRGCADIVRHGENGLVIEQQDSSSLAEAILCLAGQPKLRIMLAQRARETVIQEYEATPALLQFQSILAEIMDW
jgi:glycosyltransferase involved in cell wall biosynthesis